jgi:hypothetical protein
MTQQKMFVKPLRTWLGTVAVGVLAVAVLGMTGTATAAEAGRTGKAGQDFSCREPVGAVQTPHGRWVHLWLCDNGWHGQITSAATNDSVWLVSAADSPFGFARVAAGQTSANSATVGANGGPWKACGTWRDNAAEIRCTAPN